MTLAVVVPFIPKIFALTDVGNAGVFELDGNIAKDSSGTFPTDWAALFSSSGTSLALPPGGLDSSFVNDAPLPDITAFTTGSKDILNLPNSGWQCTSSNNVTPKDKILDVYSFAIVPSFGPRMGHLLIYGGYERFDNSGAGNVGIWLFQDPTVACSSPKGAVNFSGAHQVGDLLLTAAFTTGGTVTTLDAFKWVGGASTLLNLTAAGGNDCTIAPVTANFCARSNSGFITTPWPAQDKNSAPNTLATAEFFEVGVDLTGLLGPNPPCINRFLFDSRSSPSPTADLHDFALGSLATCPTAAITTNVSPSTIAFGGSATDTAKVTLSSSTAIVSGTVDFKVYGPVANNTPTCTTLAQSFLGVPIGPGQTPQSVTSGTFMPSAPGYYFWTATYNPASARNGNAVSTPCGDTNETLTVVKAAITTNVSSSTIAFGGSVTDTATVTLTPGTAIVSGTVDFSVYGPVATNTAACTTLAKSFLGVQIGPGVSPQSATSPSFAPSAAGYYFWTATYNPAGAANGNAVSTTCGDNGETLLVVSSSITTSVSSSVIAFGGSATDTATVTLNPSTAMVSGTVDFTVYGPVATNVATCTTVAGTFSGVAISGPGTGATAKASFTPSVSGYYFWIATYNPTSAANGNSVSTVCGDQGETLLTVSTVISTSVSPSTIALGGSAADTATVTLSPAGQTVSGTVDFFVYGPVGTNTPTCTTLAKSFTGVSIGPISGTGSATSASFTPSAPGYYFWTATYNPSGAVNGNPVSTTCGDSGETLLVVEAAISTSVSSSTIAFGGSASDTATVSLTPSTATVSGSVDFTVYGPVATNVATCTTVAGTFSGVAISGPGTGATAMASFTPSVAGYYLWIAKYNPAGAVNGNIVSTTCGDTGETLLIVSSVISTSVSPSTIALGGSASDTATVTLSPGGQTVSGTVDFFVYGPVATNVATCTTLASSFPAVPIGPGASPQSATSGSFTPSAPGYYFWTATYNPAGSANGNSVSTSCGDSGETLLVVSSAVSTSVSPSTIALGGSATDTATVMLTPSGQTVSGTADFFVYGPVASNTPTCTTLAKSFPGVSIGPGVSPQSATSGPFTPSAAGYYFWIATYNPAGSANGNSVSTSCGDNGETLLVIEASITTSVSPSQIMLVNPKVSAFDTATVTLSPSGQTVSGTVDFRVYGPFPTPTCTGTPADTFLGVQIGPGVSPQSATSGPFTPSAAGTYFWTATYNPAGPASGNTVSTSCGESGETLVVVPAQPRITTSVTTPIALGGSTTDTATILGLVNPTGTGTITFTVYTTNTAGVCSGQVFTSGSTPALVTNDGNYISDPFTPSTAGTYYWIASFSGDSNNLAVSTKCGDSGETLLVVSSAIATSVSTPVALGDSTADTATVTLSPAGQTVSGTVDFFVYGPVSTNTPTCTALAQSFLGVPISGASPAMTTSGSFTPSAPGYYFWTATYHPAGTANGNTVSTSCGDTGETLLVVQSTITTNVSPPTLTFGQSATDTATVTLSPSGQSVSGTVTFNVYGPFTSAPTASSCAPSSLITPFSPNTVSIAGPSPAMATSGSFTPSAPGYYAWIATYNPAGAANGNTVSSKCGDMGETLLVSSIPKITAFFFTNTPTNNDPTLGTGAVVYTFTIHNYGTTDVTLSGSLTVSGTASITCNGTGTGGRTLILSGTLAAGKDAPFSLTCSYSGTSGQTVQADISAMYTDMNSVTGTVSGSPTTYIFTIQTKT